MPEHCPACGAAVTYSATAGPISVGACDECGASFTVLTGLAGTLGPSAHAAAVAPSADGTAPAAPTGTPAEGIPCDVCGETVTLALADDLTLRSHCPGCEKSVRYVASDGARPRAPFPTRDGPGDRPRGRPSFSGDGPRGPPRGRPCRECGGTLRFSTDDGGNVTGECVSCGNRFTLPPRRDGPGGGGGRGFDRRGPPRRYGGGGYGGGGRRFGPPRGRGGFGGSRDRGGDDERPRRRRRDSDDE